MDLEISSAALRAIVEEADASPTREICGLLLGSGNCVTGVTPCRNVADHPEDSFEIEPAALLGAHRAARRGGAAIIGCYHSHPSGGPTPSRRDAENATPLMPFWIIVAGDEHACWHVAEAGPVAHVFSPVRVQTRP